MWRPSDWVKGGGYQDEVNGEFLWNFLCDDYEAGADAMLEALKKEGQYWGKIVEKPGFNTTKIGWLVFIEETE